MPVTITGMVFDDRNHNGVWDSGEPGISNVYLTLFNAASGACVQTFTDASGVYSFSVAAAGTYRIYETVSAASDCPPTVLTQPAGFSLSNGPRVRNLSVTAAQITAGATISGQNFSHDTVDAPLECTTAMVQFVNTPTEWFDMDVVTGAATLRGFLNPANSVNAIGYNSLDHYIYGYDQSTGHLVRADENRLLMQLAPNPTGLPSISYNVGAFDLDGHLFLMVNDTARFYTVDLAPNSATFMKLVDPSNDFAEQTSSFGTALNTAVNISDWAFRPTDGFLYGIRSVGTTAQVMRVHPATGVVTGLTTTLLGFPGLNPAGRSWGAVAMDASGALFAIYNGDGSVFRFTIVGNTAVGIQISTTFTTSFNDATMCPEALVGPIADAQAVKAVEPIPAVPGNQILYTVLVSNSGPDTADNMTLTDAVPPEVLAPEYSLDQGATFLPWAGSLNLGTFPSGKFQPVLIRGTLSPSASGIIFNTAVVSSDASDPDPNNNISTVDVDAAMSADVSVTKTAAPDPVTAGEPILFTVTVSNLGPSDAQSVALSDAVPSSILGAVYSTDGGATFLPWSGTLELGTLAAGASEIILLRGNVGSDVSDSIANTASVSSATPDPDPGNNTSTVIIPVTESADIAVSKTAPPTPVTPGQQITYRLLVSNLGPSDARNVVLADVAPSELLAPEYSLDNGTTFLPWSSPLNLETIEADTSAVILIRGTVSDSAAGSIVNTAVLSSDTPDPNPDNNSSSVTVPVSAASADLSIMKTASSETVSPAETLTYTIRVSNLGPDSADAVMLTDTIPALLIDPVYSLDGGATFLPWAGALSLGILAPNAAETVLIRGMVSPQASGSITNTAFVSSTTPDPNPDNNSSSVTVPVSAASADLSITKTASSETVSPGGTITYTIRVSNLGPDSADAVMLTDTIPALLIDPVYSLDGGATFLPWAGALSLGTLVASAAKTILIRGAVSSAASGSITNTAAISSTTPDPNPDNNSSSVEIDIRDARYQAITDLIESVALEEAALAHILNAEGEKLQRIIAVPDVEPSVLLRANQSVQSMADAVALLENTLSGKLSLFRDCLCEGTEAAQ